MTVKITIETGNVAFGDNPEVEVARILHECAKHIISDGLPDRWPLWDVNGSNVGTARTTKGDPEK